MGKEHGKDLAMRVARPTLLRSMEKVCWDQWYYEPKINGIRAVWSEGKLWSRNGKLLRKLKIEMAEGCEFDGELTGSLYNVFDLLSVDSNTITHWPIEERKLMLLRIMDICQAWGQQDVHLIKSFDVPTKASFITHVAFLKKDPLIEGIVMKRKKSCYPFGETKVWMKYK